MYHILNFNPSTLVSFVTITYYQQNAKKAQNCKFYPLSQSSKTNKQNNRCCPCQGIFFKLHILQYFFFLDKTVKVVSYNSAEANEHSCVLTSSKPSLWASLLRIFKPCLFTCTSFPPAPAILTYLKLLILMYERPWNLTTFLSGTPSFSSASFVYSYQTNLFKQLCTFFTFLSLRLACHLKVQLFFSKGIGSIYKVLLNLYVQRYLYNMYVYRKTLFFRNYPSPVVSMHYVWTIDRLTGILLDKNFASPQFAQK